MSTHPKKRVIDINPFEVSDETLAALKDEVHAQADDDLGDIDIIDVVVLDANDDGGLDSHASVFTVGDVA